LRKRGRRRAGSGARRGRTALGVAVVVAVVSGLILFGARGGYPATRPYLMSGSAWLASAKVGQLTLLDGSSAEVAAQVKVGRGGEQVDVVQQGATAYAVNRSTGALRRVDGATFEVSPPATPLSGAGAGLRAFAGPDALYALDAQRGVVTGVDPKTLTNRGTLLPLAAQVAPESAVLDPTGRLWLLDSATGDLLWMRDGQRRTRTGAATPGAGTLTLADGAPVLVDTQRRTATVLDPHTGAVRHVVGLDLRPGDRLQVSGSPHRPVLYTVAERGLLAVCDLTHAACGTAVALGAENGSSFGTPVESGGRVFVPDYTSGRVWIVDLQRSKVIAQPQVLSPNVRFQLLTRDGVVFFNDPDSEHAGVIRLDGGVRPVAKYGSKDTPGEAPNSSPATPQPPKPPSVPAPPASPPASPSAPPPDNAGPPPGPPPGGPPPGPPGPGAAPPIQIALSTLTPRVGDVVAVKVTAVSGPDPATAQWSFGDGQTANGVLTSHRWNAAGPYQVSVRATVPGHQVSVASLTIQVTSRPVLTVQTPSGGTVTGGGISCPPTCTLAYDPGQSVTLSAQPGAGNAFTGWGGACAGTGTCQVVMNGNKTVSAAFAGPVTLTVPARITPGRPFQITIEFRNTTSGPLSNPHFYFYLSLPPNSGIGRCKPPLNLADVSASVSGSSTTVETWQTAGNGATDNCQIGFENAPNDTYTLPAGGKLTWRLTVTVRPPAGSTTLSYGGNMADPAKFSTPYAHIRNGDIRIG
jgi:hypothetical protein